MRLPEERLRGIIAQLRTEDHVDRYRVAEDLEVVLAGYAVGKPDAEYIALESSTGHQHATNALVGGVRIKGIKSISWGIDIEKDGPVGLVTLRAVADVDINQQGPGA